MCLCLCLCLCLCVRGAVHGHSQCPPRPIGETFCGRRARAPTPCLCGSAAHCAEYAVCIVFLQFGAGAWRDTPLRLCGRPGSGDPSALCAAGGVDCAASGAGWTVARQQSRPAFPASTCCWPAPCLSTACVRPLDRAPLTTAMVSLAAWSSGSICKPFWHRCGGRWPHNIVLLT